MPEIKNTFIKSKMNKDLDSRLVPNGEYREAINASVSTSEDADVGALENIISNRALLNEKLLSNYDNLEIIGYCRDERKDRVFLFATNYTDGTIDQSGRPLGDRTVRDPKDQTNLIDVTGSACLIICYDINNNSTQIIVDGAFLNFSKSSPVTASNIIEDLLFWTDNRNQPRKINVESAITDPSYYTYEEHVSVAKFAPYRPISFLRDNVYNRSYAECSLIDQSSDYLPPHISTTFNTWAGAGVNVAQIESTVSNDRYQCPYIWIVGDDYIADATALGFFPHNYTYGTTHGSYSALSDYWRVMKVTNRNTDTSFFLRSAKRVAPTGAYTDQLTFAPTNFIDSSTPAMTSEETKWQPGDVLDISIPNPYYDNSFLNTNKDNDYLRDKFVRFSYRFKYDDNEYSILAPFSQVAFIPKQQGRWLYDDDENSKRSGIVAFMENSINYVGLTIPTPDDMAGQGPLNLSELLDYHKIKELQIVCKSSDELGVKVIADLTSTEFLSIGSTLTASISEAGSGYNSPYDDNNVTLTAFRTGDSKGEYLSFVSQPSTPGTGIIDYIKPDPITRGVNVAEGDEYILRDPSNPTLSTAAKIKIDALMPYFYYEYKSEKPIRTLPESVLTRVADITPMRALAQESVGGRIVYGNFLQNLETPKSLDFDISVDNRDVATQINGNNPNDNSEIPIELPYHSLKQNRTYKVGLVLYDKWGRASNVITSSNNDACFSNIINGSDSPMEWWGNCLTVTMNEVIPEARTPNYNGVWKELSPNAEANPLGWYSYRFVVQQLQQDYYNLYVPGTTSGIFKFDPGGQEWQSGTLTYEGENSSAMIAIFGDNINKLPRDLKEVGPQDKIYGSSKKLWNRLYANEWTDNEKTQIWGQEVNPSAIEVSDIKPFRELGDWTDKRGVDVSKLYAPQGQIGASSSYPYPGQTGTSDPFFRAQENPFIAILDVSKRYGFLTSLPYSSTTTGWTPFTGGVQDSGMHEIPAYETFQFSQKLNIYEVEPVTSAIDIFYETSTTGLISDLNEAIRNTVLPPANYDLDFFNLTYSEGTSPGSIVSSEFTIIDDFGAYLNQEFAFIELDSISKVSLNSIGSVVGATPVDITNTPYPQANSNTQPYQNIRKFKLVQTQVGSASPAASPRYALRYADISVSNSAENLDYFSSTSDNEEHYIFKFKITDEDGNSNFVEKQGTMSNRTGAITLAELPDTRLATPKWIVNALGDYYSPLSGPVSIFGNRNYSPDNISFWDENNGGPSYDRFWGDGSLGEGTDLGFYRYRCFNNFVNNGNKSVRENSLYEVDDCFNCSLADGDSWERSTGKVFSTFTLNQPNFDASSYTYSGAGSVPGQIGWFQNSSGARVFPQVSPTWSVMSTPDMNVQLNNHPDVDKMIMLLDDHDNGAWGSTVDDEGVAYRIRRAGLDFGLHDISGDNKNKFRLINSTGYEYNNYSSSTTNSTRPNLLNSPDPLFEVVRMKRREIFTYRLPPQYVSSWDIDVVSPDGNGTETVQLFPDSSDILMKLWIVPQAGSSSTGNTTSGILYGEGQFWRYEPNSSGTSWTKIYTWDGRPKLAPKGIYKLGTVEIDTNTLNAGGKNWDDYVYFVKWNGGGFSADEGFGSGDNQDIGGRWNGSSGTSIELNKNVRSGKRGAARLFVEVEAYDAADFSDPNNVLPGAGSLSLDVVGNNNNFIRGAFVVYDKQSNSCPGSGDS